MSYSDRMREMSPPPLQSDPRFVQGLGTGLDRLLSNFKDAIKARFPTYAAANGDAYALANIGADSSMPRYPSETDAQYGARLQQRWLLYARAGAAASPTDPATYPNPIVHEFEGLGFGDITIMEYIDWPDYSAVPNAHESPLPILDSVGTPYFSQFSIWIGSYNGSPIPDGAVMGTGVMGTDQMGVSLSLAVINSAVAAALQWKPAHALLTSFYWLLSGTTISAVMGVALMGTSTMGPGIGSGVVEQQIDK